MGKLIIFPTDTVYGIGCEILDLENINKIYEIKKRPMNKPLACLCANFEQIESIAEVNPIVEKLVQAFLPGALTIILKTNPYILQHIGYETIGVRIPNHQTALKILEMQGPMLTTSVNDSGESSMNCYEQIVAKYKDIVDEIYEPSEKMSEVASTVISFLNNELKLIREGEISLESIKKIIFE